eukprot:403354503
MFTGRNSTKQKTFKFRKNTLNQLPVEKGPINRQIRIVIKSNDKEQEFYFGQDYWWFFKQILLTNLPSGWEREYDIDGYTQFNSIEENIQTREHPLRYYFRKLFLRILSLEKEFNRQITMDDLAIDEQYLKILNKTKIKREASLIKRTIAQQKAVVGTLSMDFYQRNLSKTKKEISKGDPQFENIFEVDNAKSKRRMKILIKKIKDQRVEAPEGYIKFEEQDTETRIKILQDIEKESMAYYESNFGDFLKTKEIIESFLFKQMNMTQILSLGSIYGIDILNESYLLWLPQYLMCLPLPHDWKRKTDQKNNQNTYFHCSRFLETKFHPIEPFAMSMIERGRIYYKENPQMLSEIKNKLRTFDNVLRNFTLNMNQVRMFFEQQEKKMKKLENKNANPIDQLQSDQNFQEKKSDQDQYLNINQAPEAKYVEEKSQFSIKETFKRRKFLKCTQKDIEIFVVANQCNVDLNVDVHILYLISDLMDAINKQSDEAWQFRYINDQKFYWQNKEKTLKTQTYPFLSNIMEKIQILKTQTENLRGQEIDNYLKQHYVSIKEVQGLRGQQTLEKIKDERQEFTRNILLQFLKNKENKLFIEDIKDQLEGNGENLDQISYDMKILSQFLSNRLSKDELLDVILFCPFNLEREKMNVIQDDLSSIQIPLINDISSDSEFSTPGSFSGLMKKKVDPRDLLLRNRQQSSFNRKSSNQEKKLSSVKSSNTLKVEQSLENKKKSDDITQAMSILNQRKRTVLGEYSDEEESNSQNKFKLSDLKLSLHGSDHNLNGNDDARLCSIDLAKPQQERKSTTRLSQGSDKNLSPEQYRRGSKLYEKVENFYQKKSGGILAQNDIKEEPQTPSQKSSTSMQFSPKEHPQPNDTLGVLQVTSFQDKTGTKKSTFFKKESSKDEYKELNFKSVGVKRRRQAPPSQLDPQYLIPNKVEMKKHSSQNLQTPRTLLYMNDLKKKLFGDNQRAKPIHRLKKLLKKNYVKPEKFQRMLKVSQDHGVAIRFKKLLIKYQLIKLLKENPNNPDVARNLKNMEEQRKSLKIRKSIEQAKIQIQEEPQKGIMSLLGIIDKNKFHIEKPVEVQEDIEESFSIFDENNFLKPFDYELIAEENFDDLNITKEFYNILDNYKQMAQGKRKKSTNDNAQQPLTRRNTILDIAGMMFLKNLESKKTKKHNSQDTNVEETQLQLLQNQESISYINQVKNKLKLVTQNIQNQMVNSPQDNNDHPKANIEGDNSINQSASKQKNTEKNHFSYFSFKNGNTLGAQKEQLDLKQQSQNKFTSANKKNSSHSSIIPSTFSSHSSDYSSFKTSSNDENSQSSKRSKASHNSKNFQRRRAMRKEAKFTNFKHVGGEKLQNLDEFFKHGNQKISGLGDKDDMFQRIKDGNFKLKRQSDFKNDDDYNESEGFSPQKIENKILLSDGQKYPSNGSLGSSNVQNTSQNQTVGQENQSSAPVKKENEMYSKRISEFFRETIQMNPDILKDLSPSQTLKSKLSVKEKDNESKNHNVIQEVHESDSSLDLEEFKILHHYQNYNRESLGSQQSVPFSQRTNDEPYLKSILRFKFSRGSMNQSQQSLSNFKPANPILKGSKHQKSQSITNFQSLIKTQRNQFDKFTQQQHIQNSQSPKRVSILERFDSFNQNQYYTKAIAVDLIQQKRDNFLNYCKIFGNPQNHPSKLNLFDDIQALKPIHVIRMGQTLNLLKKDTRNETYLLWISKQILLMPLSKDILQPNQTLEHQFDDIIQLVRNKTHPALDYIKCLMHFQRRIFHEFSIKQMHLDQFKRDCSWLAFLEDALDYQGNKIGERIYYYNFMTYQKSLIKPEELNLKQSINYVYESEITKQKYQNKKTSGFMTERRANQEHQMADIDLIEKKYDSALLKSIKLILKKRKQQHLCIERQPSIKKKSMTIAQESPMKSQERRLSKSKVSMKFTKSKLYSSTDQRISITRENKTPFNENNTHILPSLLIRSTVDRTMAQTAVTSILGTKLNSRDVSREHKRTKSFTSTFTANIYNKNKPDLASNSLNVFNPGVSQDSRIFEQKQMHKQVQGRLMMHNLKAIQFNK